MFSHAQISVLHAFPRFNLYHLAHVHCPLRSRDIFLFSTSQLHLIFISESNLLLVFHQSVWFLLSSFWPNLYISVTYRIYLSVPTPLQRQFERILCLLPTVIKSRQWFLSQKLYFGFGCFLQPLPHFPRVKISSTPQNIWSPPPFESPPFYLLLSHYSNSITSVQKDSNEQRLFVAHCPIGRAQEARSEKYKQFTLLWTQRSTTRNCDNEVQGQVIVV